MKMSKKFAVFAQKPKQKKKRLEEENRQLREQVSRLEQMVKDRELYVARTAGELEEYRKKNPSDPEELRKQEKMQKDWEKLLGYTGRVRSVSHETEA